MDIKKTANSFANFTIKRIAESFGVTVFCAGVLLLLALITYSPEDPNFIFPENTKIENILYIVKHVQENKDNRCIYCAGKR